MESRVFQDALELAESEMGSQVRRTCLGCHAPVAVRTNDLALRRKVSWEGITCDYCHSIESVSTAGPNPTAKVQFSLVKNGPLKDAHSTGHTTAYSEAFTSSLVCAPCHEYTDAYGFPVLTTYTEWKNSRAAKEGKQCQTCHMYQVAGKVVDPRILRGEEAQINLHAMPGSHSLEQLNKTIGATLTTAREGGQLRITVEVANKFAGHSVPTGSPLRQIVLEVAADSYGGKHFKSSRVYRRAVADEHGREIDREHLAMVKPAKLLSDTRLGAG
jgi:nitrate/TMAO reductase-like tetraheme cytochrome c subunit